jgi:outer membrane protein TolC
MRGPIELLSWVVLGQATPLAVTFEEALLRADQHPEVQAIVAAAKARDSIDGSLSALTHNPNFTVGPGWRFSTVNDDGLDFQVSFQLPFVLSDLADARKASAEAERAVLGAEQAAVLLERRLLSARSWFELKEREIELEGLSRAEALGQRTTALVERAAEAGLLTQVDLHEARAHTDEIVLERLDAEGRLFECSLHLAAALAEPPDRAMRTSGPLPRFELPTERDQWVEKTAALPSTALLRERARAMASFSVEQESEAADTFSAGAQLQRESPTEGIAFLMFGWSPSWFNDGARHRAGAVERKVRAEEAAEREARENRRFLVELFHEIEHTQEIVEHLETVMVPSLRATHEGRARQLSLGETSLLAVLDAERRLLAGELRLVRAQTAAAWARARAFHVLSSVGIASNTKEHR